MSNLATQKKRRCPGSGACVYQKVVFMKKNLVFRQRPWFGLHKRFERYQLPEKMPALRRFTV